jgi:low affinity Fe/Cu permease
MVAGVAAGAVVLLAALWGPVIGLSGLWQLYLNTALSAFAVVAVLLVVGYRLIAPSPVDLEDLSSEQLDELYHRLFALDDERSPSRQPKLRLRVVASPLGRKNPSLYIQ